MASNNYRSPVTICGFRQTPAPVAIGMSLTRRCSLLRSRKGVVQTWVALIGFRGGAGSVTPPGLRRGRRARLCRVGARCARTGSSRDKAAACPARCPGAGEARSVEETKPFHGVDVDLAKAGAVFVAGVFAAPMADRLVLVAPSRQAGVNAVLVGVDESALGHGRLDDRLDRGLLHVGQHVQDHLAAALDQAKDRWFVLRQRTASRRACQLAAAPEPPLLATAAGWPLCPATT